MRTTGAPARSSAATARSCSCDGAKESRTYTWSRSSPPARGAPTDSPTTGTTPFPCFPSDSATSCSIQSASPAIPGEVTRVSLSTPSRAAAPSTTPRTSPGLSSPGRSAAQASAMTSARSSRRGTLTPMAAAGTMPKWESAEKRPPTLGSPWKTFRKPSRWACLSRSVPGSVMATKRLAAWPPRRLRVRSRKWARSAAGSMVVPDLDATMKSVRRRSISRSSERICAGTVESRT